MPDLYEEIVDSLAELKGTHAGFRTVHAKGTLCAGAFTASPAAASLSRAAHLNGQPVRVTARFSNGSGDPRDPDADRLDGRGLAVKFYLPDGATADLVALSIPVFFVRREADFLEFTRARKPDPASGQPNPERVGAFLAAHPETAAALQLILPALTPPRSYAELAYNSLHAFGLENAEGQRRFARLRWTPESGEHRLAEDQIDGMPPDYLQEDIAQRVGAGPVGFKLEAVLAEEGDPLEDPTVPWPPERSTVDLGQLELTGLDTTREGDGDVLVFDPTRVPDGVVLPDDEILHARSRAYSVSVERRTGIGRPPEVG